MEIGKTNKTLAGIRLPASRKQVNALALGAMSRCGQVIQVTPAFTQHGTTLVRKLLYVVRMRQNSPKPFCELRL